MSQLLATWGRADTTGAEPTGLPPDLPVKAFMGWDGLIVQDEEASSTWSI